MKKLLAIILSFTLLAHSVVPSVLAQEIAPTPETPVVPTAPSAPTVPTVPTIPTAPSTPTELTTPTPTQEPTPKPTRTPRQNEDEERTVTPTPTPVQEQTTEQEVIPTTTSEEQNSQPTEGGNVGDTRIATGDSSNSATILTTANNNGAESNANPGATIVENTGNGVDSSNDASASIVDNTNTIQNNIADINNDLALNSDTGNNDASKNVGDTFVKTGDANVSGTVITAVNTNVDGVMVSEFNVEDNHTGDIVLDFAAGCLSGCNTGTQSTTNQKNGANSTNTATTDTTVNNATFQNNDATVGNSLVLDANSGNNNASYNTNGENVIYTGDANVSANALTFANNNFAGNVVYGVVNIYGDLVGDIIFPEEQITNCCGTQNSTATNQGNGANSTNTAMVSDTTTNATFQTNDAVIDNTLILDAETGGNAVSGNTTGDNRVYTGDANVQANVINVANNNLEGGNMWLVIVNEAGKWIGKILGSPEGSTMAGSEGTIFTTNEKGEIVASNTGNGANSDNSVNNSQETNNTLVQNNTANINNVLDLSATTGNNKASYNTGGDSSIVTGDANIIANMINFVNNNVVGNGKLFVTVVNVFGSWLGDFVTPGQQKQVHQTQSEVAVVNQQQSTTQSTQSPSSSTAEGTKVAPTPTETPSVLGALTKVITKTTTKPSIIESLDEQTNEELATFTEVTSDEATDVAAIKTQVAGKKVISINLAWLIFLVPGGILLVATRKLLRFALHRLPRS